MGTINPVKAFDVSLMPHSRVIHPGTIKGTELDVSGDYELGIFMNHGFVEDANNTSPGRFVIFGSPKTSGDDAWTPITYFQVMNTNPDKVNINASEAAGQTDLTVDVITGLVTNDLLYIQDTNGNSPSSSTGALSGAELNSEWAFMVKAVSTTVTLATGLVNAKDSNDDIYNDASRFYWRGSVSTLARIRVDFVHEGAVGANCDVLVLGVRFIEDETA